MSPCKPWLVCRALRYRPMHQ